MNIAWVKGMLQAGKHFVTKNASHLLMGVGTVSGVSAAVCATKIASAAKQSVEDQEAIVGRKLTVWEWLKAIYRYYGPVAAVEMLSLACFWTAHGIDIHRQAIFAGLAATAEEALREYQRKTMEMIGKDAEKEVRNAIAQDQVDRLPPATNNFYINNEAEDEFIFKGQRFRSTYNRIKEAENLANKEMIQHMYISELELIWLLDPDKKYLKPDWDSGQVGWSVDEFITLDIHWVPNENHRPIGVIDIVDSNGMRYTPSPGFCRMA